MQTLAQSSEWIKESLTSLNPNIDKYAIILKSSVEPGMKPRMIGLVGTKAPGDEMVYMLNHLYWRQGYMSEAIVAFAGPEGIFWKLENRKHITSLMADIDTENFNSVKTIKKVGGREGETTMKCYGLYRDKGPDGIVPEEKKRGFTRWYVDRPAVEMS
ncbi:hypothetical protein BGZ60DRAFT_427184 [Tricladium varicosporioides]|nr:hypothetical protein BGZ60DRAFT_427184 [Hymenoscyphus varicosporioides]